MVQNCLKAQTLLAKLGIEVTVADARFCKPLDIKLLRELCRNHAFLITVEEGAIGGFGSHVAQFMALDGQLDGRTKVMFQPLFQQVKIPLIKRCVVIFVSGFDMVENWEVWLVLRSFSYFLAGDSNK